MDLHDTPFRKDTFRLANLHRGSRVLPRQAGPLQPLHLAPICERWERMSLLRRPLVRWLEPARKLHDEGKK
jgi:hypothetical protein